jgi:sporulation protein YlmC with PRC-barrel domain
MSEMNARTRLVKLADTTLKLDPSDDVRGRKVYDKSDDEVGKVADLVVDEGERRVRFLEVQQGGVLGIGTTDLLIPVDAVTHVAEDRVRIDQTRDHISGAPRYDPNLDEEKYWTDVYSYWGYSPYWTAGYLPPTYSRGPWW